MILGIFFLCVFCLVVFLLVFVIYLCKPWCIDRYWQNRWRLYLPDLNWRTLNFSFKSPRSKRGEDVSGARSFGRCSRCFCGYGARKLETVFQAVIRIPVPSRELNGTNISPTKIYKGTFEDEVLFPRWDMLPSWRMYRYMRFVPTHQDSSQKHHILHDVANTFACNKQVDTSKHIAKFGGKELYYRSVPLFMKVWWPLSWFAKTRNLYLWIHVLFLRISTSDNDLWGTFSTKQSFLMVYRHFNHTSKSGLDQKH